LAVFAQLIAVVMGM